MRKKLSAAIMLCLFPTFSFANCNDAVTTNERAYCNKLDFEAADTKLNTMYSQLNNLAKSYFATYNPNSKQMDNGVSETLLISQRAWIKYRDENCKYYYATYYPGTEANIILEQCKTRMTIERTKELEKEFQFWSTR
jgi:uncharacterized protein YecT (DUF1311 family)